MAKKDDAWLEPNHNYFILVEDEEIEWGAEITFRANLEKAIKDTYQNVKIEIPQILIVVEGGRGTLKTVYNSIRNQIPVLLVEVNKYFEFYIIKRNILK